MVWIGNNQMRKEQVTLSSIFSANDKQLFSNENGCGTHGAAQHSSALPHTLIPCLPAKRIFQFHLA